jgi:hypothetical protein
MYIRAVWGIITTTTTIAIAARVLESGHAITK